MLTGLCLTYPGDLTTDVVGQVVGPDEFGGYLRAVEAEHDPERNKTRVRFRPVTAAELAEQLQGLQ